MKPAAARPHTKRAYLRDLVEQKNAGFRPLTDEERHLGFLGWHERGYLPHCDYPGLVQLVTFRLADSLPASRRGEWQHLLTMEDSREKRRRLESFLDQGAGECLLQRVELAHLVESACLHRHGQDFELLAWVVMPNHAHVLVQVWDVPLGQLLLSWKSYSAKRVNRALGRRGRV
jgi:hypothetical protein